MALYKVVFAQTKAVVCHIIHPLGTVSAYVNSAHRMSMN